MTIRPRRNHSPAFKAKVAHAMIKADKTLIDLAQDIDPSQSLDWLNNRRQFEPIGSILCKLEHIPHGHVTRNN